MRSTREHVCVALACAVEQHDLQQTDFGSITQRRKVAKGGNDLLQSTMLGRWRHVVGIVAMRVSLFAQRIGKHERLLVGDVRQQRQRVAMLRLGLVAEASDKV